MEPQKSTHILIVEDNDDDSFMLIRQLERAQIHDHATVITNGREALDLLLKESAAPPLAVFLDLHLPGLGGIQVLEGIRKTPHLESVPVFIMTGSDDPKELEECRKLGITAYLPKPIQLRTFIKAVAHLFPKAVAPESQ